MATPDNGHNQAAQNMPAIAKREAAPYSRVRGGARYTQVAASRKRKKHIATTVVATLIAVVLIAAGIAAASVANFYRSVGERLNEGVDVQTKAVLADQQAAAQQLTSNWSDTSPFYVLVIGTDASTSRMYGVESDQYGASEANFRSDTMILARVDPGNQKVALVSIHRDTLYPFSWGWDKINAAYPNGGIPLVIQTISDFAGVPISHYVQVNLDGLYDIVDTLGGVEVDVPYEINDSEFLWYLNGGHLDAGLQTLNGEQAELFVRSRHTYDNIGDGDRYRAAHQRLFISAVIEKLLSSSPIDMVAAVNSMANYVSTDLTLDEIVNLALAMRGLDVENDIYSTMNPTTAAYENGVWYEYSNDDYWHYIMQQIDAGEKPDIDTAYRSVTDDINSSNYGTIPLTTENCSVSVKNASGDPARLTAVLQTLWNGGWQAYDSGAANISLDQTTVVYENDLAYDAAVQIAASLGTVPEYAGSTWMMDGDVMVVIGAV